MEFVLGFLIGCIWGMFVSYVICSFWKKQTDRAYEWVIKRLGETRR